MGFEVAGLWPDRVELLPGFTVPVTMITLWIVSAILIVLALVFRFVILKKFKEKPTGIQNVLELGVESANNLAKSKLREKGRSIAPYVMTLAIVIVCSGLVELVGVRAPETDLNFTIALALITFILINAYGIRYKGAWGRIKSFGEPVKAIAPINLVTHCAVPISLSCRMFGNLFSGLVIMELIYYALGYFAVGIPAVLSIYFNLFHIGMQAYVFLVLSLSFINEAVE